MPLPSNSQTAQQCNVFTHISHHHPGPTLPASYPNPNLTLTPHHSHYHQIRRSTVSPLCPHGEPTLKPTSNPATVHHFNTPSPIEPHGSVQPVPPLPQLTITPFQQSNAHAAPRSRSAPSHLAGITSLPNPNSPPPPLRARRRRRRTP